MRVEYRQRTIVNDGVRLHHYDLLVIAENANDSLMLDLLGQPGSTFVGEVRLADDYGDHYLMLQPKKMIMSGGVGSTFREFDRS